MSAALGPHSDLRWQISCRHPKGGQPITRLTLHNASDRAGEAVFHARGDGLTVHIDRCIYDISCSQVASSDSPTLAASRSGPKLYPHSSILLLDDFEHWARRAHLDWPALGTQARSLLPNMLTELAANDADRLVDSDRIMRQIIKADRHRSTKHAPVLRAYREFVHEIEDNSKPTTPSSAADGLSNGHKALPPSAATDDASSDDLSESYQHESSSRYSQEDSKVSSRSSEESFASEHSRVASRTIYDNLRVPTPTAVAPIIPASKLAASWLKDLRASVPDPPAPRSLRLTLRRSASGLVTAANIVFPPQPSHPSEYTSYTKPTSSEIDAQNEWNELLETHLEPDGTTWADGKRRSTRRVVVPDPLDHSNDSDTSEDWAPQGDDLDDSIVCDVCGIGEAVGSNKIVICENDDCEAAVHQFCYGVAKIPEGRWLCDRCARLGEGRFKEASCVACPRREGAMKQSPEGHWVHIADIFCSEWLTIEPRSLAGATITGLDNGHVIPIMEALQKRTPHRCTFCKSDVGLCVNCISPSCPVYFHPLCARNAKDSQGRAGVTVIQRSSGPGEEYTFIFLCGIHAPKRAEYMDMHSAAEQQSEADSHSRQSDGTQRAKPGPKRGRTGPRHVVTRLPSIQDISPRYIAERDTFLRQLATVNEVPSPHRLPNFCGKPLDLFNLYYHVVARGGHTAVRNATGAYAAIFRELDNYRPQETSGSYRLATQYANLLLQMEARYASDPDHLYGVRAMQSRALEQCRQRNEDHVVDTPEPFYGFADDVINGHLKIDPDEIRGLRITMTAVHPMRAASAGIRTPERPMQPIVARPPAGSTASSIAGSTFLPSAIRVSGPARLPATAAAVSLVRANSAPLARSRGRHESPRAAVDEATARRLKRLFADPAAVRSMEFDVDEVDGMMVWGSRHVELLGRGLR